MTARRPRVLDAAIGIAGAYCAKVFADAGAHVDHLEDPGEDPLRRSLSGSLYEHLHLGAHPVEGDAEALAAGYDVVLTGDAELPERLLAAHPSLVVVSITPFGTGGPWRDRPATEFTLQAACGSTGERGSADDGPLAAGGRLGEWITGTYAAVGALAALRRARRQGVGAHVDASMLDAMAVTMVTFPSVFAELSGWPELRGATRHRETPSIEPTADGWIVVTTNSATQFTDFLVMIERPDLLEDEALRLAANRVARRDEFLRAVHAWTTPRTSEEVLEQAGLFRIPAGPVLNGETVPEFEHFRARGVFSPEPGGRFIRPRLPYRMGPTTDAPNLLPAVAGSDPTGRPLAPTVNGTGPPHGVGAAHPPAAGMSGAGPVGASGGSPLPLDGVRVLDCTAWWAGPVSPHLMGALGADVIKVEATTRPDFMRYASTRPPTEDRWWEWGPVFHGVNTNKRGLTLDLTVEEGRELFERLVRTADVLVENFTPRVMDQFGLTWERLREVNPRLVMVRMPAFGLDGPWRDRTGFAQTMESLTGLAWLTGLPDGPPTLVRGACDPVSGAHATIATLLALEERDATGEGRFIEVTMAEAALNVAAEAVIECSATGQLLDRIGNRGLDHALQGVYRAAGDDAWIALAVTADDQWSALCAVLGADASTAGPTIAGDLAADPALATVDGRRAAHDRIDAAVAAWVAPLEPAQAVDRLQAAGIPAEVVIRGRDIARNPQLRHRGLFETEQHPVCGAAEVPMMPFRLTGVDRWLRLPAPTLGEHNAEILGELGVDEVELARLEASGIVGTRPRGA